MGDARCQIELLGRLRVEQDGRVMTRFRDRKTEALLAYLVYFRQRAHPREELIALLWPDSAAHAGRISLNTALSALYKQLIPPNTPRAAIFLSDRTCVQFNPAACTTDVTAFENALRAAAKATTAAQKAHFLAEAIARYGGELLPGHYEDWSLAERTRLHHAYLH